MKQSSIQLSPEQKEKLKQYAEDGIPYHTIISDLMSREDWKILIFRLNAKLDKIIKMLEEIKWKK